MKCHLWISIYASLDNINIIVSSLLNYINEIIEGTANTTIYVNLILFLPFRYNNSILIFSSETPQKVYNFNFLILLFMYLLILNIWQFNRFNLISIYCIYRPLLKGIRYSHLINLNRLWLRIPIGTERKTKQPEIIEFLETNNKFK